jgi:hypothetical protein
MQHAPAGMRQGICRREAASAAIRTQNRGMVDPGSQNTNPAATVRAGPIDLAEPGCRTGQHRDAGGTEVAKAHAIAAPWWTPAVPVVHRRVLGPWGFARERELRWP